MLNLMVDPPARIVGKRQLGFRAPRGGDARASSFLDDRLGLMRVLGRSSQNPPVRPPARQCEPAGEDARQKAPKRNGHGRNDATATSREVLAGLLGVLSWL